MTRYHFADVVFEARGNNWGAPLPNERVFTAWDSPTGSQLTNLSLDAAGTMPISTVTSDANGSVDFYGPDGVESLYLKAPNGTFVLVSARMTPSDMLTTFVAYIAPSGDSTGTVDTAAIQAALDAGKTAVLSRGVYWVKNLHPRTSTGIQLNGATLKLPAAANTDVIANDDFYTLFRSGSTAGVHDFTLIGPGDIDGNAAAQTTTNTTVNQANFNLSSSFSLVVANSSLLPSTGTGTVRTQNGVQQFSWTANNTSTNTLTCTSTDGGRVATGSIICTKGYGAAIYGRSIQVKDVNIHNCVADGLITEWAASVNAGTGTSEMESFFENGKFYENGRNGHTFNGPHDSEIRSCIWFRNSQSGSAGAAGLMIASSAIVYVTAGHAWGFPQTIGIEDFTGAQFFGVTSEASGTNSRAFVLWAANAALNGCYVISASGGGSAGVELRGSNCSGVRIDATFANAYSTGAILLNGDAGGHYIRGILSSYGSASPISGTPHPADIIDLIPGAGSTFARWTQGFARQTTLLLASPRLFNSQGSAAASTVGTDALTRTGVWLLDSASVEGVSTVLEVPEAWRSANISLLWTNTTTTAGDVVWQVFTQQFDATDSVTTSAAQLGSNVTASAPTTIGNSIKTTAGAAITFTGPKLLRIAVRRKADDAADTLVNDAGLIGILLERAT